MSKIPAGRDAGGGGRGDMCPPSFGISVNPIRSKGSRLCPPYYYWPPIFLNDAASLYIISVLTHTNPCMHMMQGGSLRNLAPPKWWTPFCSSLLWGCSSMVIWFLPGKWFFLSGFTGLLLDSFTQSWLQLRSKFLLRVWPQLRQPLPISWKVWVSVCHLFIVKSMFL